MLHRRLQPCALPRPVRVLVVLAVFAGAGAVADDEVAAQLPGEPDAPATADAGSPGIVASVVSGTISLIIAFAVR